LIAERGRDGRELLYEHQSPGKIDALCGALMIAGDARVRRVLCNLLASLADKDALPCLLESLDDSEPSVVAAAADAVGNCAFDQVLSEDLQQKLGAKLMSLVGDSPTLEVRTGAIYGLGLMRYTPAIALLLAAVESEHPLERSASAEALAHIGDPEVAPALVSRQSREHDEHVLRYLKLALEELATR
jgi:HEAT repeat protein